MQHHFLYYFFSLTTDMNNFSRNPRVPAVQDGKPKYDPCGPGVSGVRVLFFASGNLSIPLRLQTMASLKEGDQRQMWEFIHI